MSTAIDIGLCGPRNPLALSASITTRPLDESWYAVFTVPKHEKAVLRHLEARGIESFLPSYEITRQWRNRQRVKLVLPLFPCYLFVRNSYLDYGRILQTPGAIRLIGNQRGPLPVPNSAIELLRAGVAERKVQPFHELVVGKRVRVKSGAMQGVEGILIRKNNALRFILSIELINQSASIEMDGENLEPITDHSTEAGVRRQFDCAS